MILIKNFLNYFLLPSITFRTNCSLATCIIYFPTNWAFVSNSFKSFYFNLWIIIKIDFCFWSNTSSEKLIFSTNFLCLLFNWIFKWASKLDPISLLALFSSMLILQISLIFISSFHLLFNSSLLNSSGNSKNFSRWMLLFSFDSNL